MSKRALGPNEVLWTMDTKQGKLGIFFGPDPLDKLTGDDKPLLPNNDDGTRLEVADETDLSSAIQPFVTLGPQQYAVIKNPAAGGVSDNFPNGTWRAGKQELIDLKFGKMSVVARGHFPLWPHQEIEVRDVHVLGSNQYLLVKVVSPEDVDVQAPYYSLLVACAQIKAAVVDDAKDVNAGKKTGPGETETEEGDQESPPSDEKTGEGGTDGGPGNVPGQAGTGSTDIDSLEKGGAGIGSSGPYHFRPGELVIIPGSKTQTFIPPTGTEVVQEASDTLSGDDGSTTDEEEYVDGFFKDRLTRLIDNEDITSRTLDDALENADLYRKYSEVMRTYRSKYDKYGNTTRALREALFEVLKRNEMELFMSRYGVSKPERAGAIKKIPPRDVKINVVRQAVVLSPAEFCVLLNEEGQPQPVAGPGRVFPGPYDRFREEGSRNRVYDAYHMTLESGLLLRITATSINRDDLETLLPVGVKGVEEKSLYSKGDELFVHGVQAYIVPQASFDIIDPTTNKPHIGNDHTTVFVTAIPVDGKSGVYVEDMQSGEVQLVSGPKAVLIDPRRQRHYKRSISGANWNLWVGENEPHKKVSQLQDGVVTPWAVSIPVPSNKAILITGRRGQRCVVGPETVLLKHDEVLERLELSTGRPKSDDGHLETCFLRMKGNRITDQVNLETKDFVSIVVDLSFGLHFVGNNDLQKINWFTHKNYIAVMVQHIRSVLRAKARTMTLHELYPSMTEVIRDTVLGPKEGDNPRPGMLFADNDMMIDEVEVLTYKIPDVHIASQLEDANRTIATLKIGDVAAQAQLDSDKLRAGIAEEKAMLDTAEVVRKTELALTREQSDHVTRSTALQLSHKLNDDAQKADHDRAKKEQAHQDVLAEAARKQRAADAENTLKITTASDAQVAQQKEALSKIEIAIATALAGADKDRLSALQPQLIAALEAVSESELMKVLAEKLPQHDGGLSLLLGGGGIKALTDFVGIDSKFGRALKRLIPSDQKVIAEHSTTSQTE